MPSQRRRERRMKRNRLENPNYPPKSGTCLLFSKLPGELRTIVYEFVFGADCQKHINNKGDVSLFKSYPPSLDILLTCHAILREAWGLYLDNSRRFWNTSHFVVDPNIEPFSAANIRSLKPLCSPSKFDRLTTVTVHLRRNHRHRGEDDWSAKLIDRRGVWEMRIDGDENWQGFYVAVPREKKKVKRGKKPLKWKWDDFEKMREAMDRVNEMKKLVPLGIQLWWFAQKYL